MGGVVSYFYADEATQPQDMEAAKTQDEQHKAGAEAARPQDDSAEQCTTGRTAPWLWPFFTEEEEPRSPPGLSRRPSYFARLGCASELRSLHAARKTPFDPDGSAVHMKLLHSIWAALRTDAFVRSGHGWKEIGFQGADPATDVRAGGLLAVQAIAHFATLQTHGFRLMLREVARSAEQSPDHYYPAACTAVVCCAALCDALGISDGMRGAVSEEALSRLVNARHVCREVAQTRGAGRWAPGLLLTRRRPASAQPASALSPLLFTSFSSWALGRRGGFLGLFSLLFAEHAAPRLGPAALAEPSCDSLPLTRSALAPRALRDDSFHARWQKYHVGYMQTQELLAECVARLKARAERLGRGDGFAQLRATYCADAEVPEMAVLLGERQEEVRKLKAAGDAVRASIVLNRHQQERVAEAAAAADSKV